MTLLGEAILGDRPVWNVEMRLTPSHPSAKTVARIVRVIDKERFVTLKSTYYDPDNQPIRVIEASHVELVGDDSVAKRRIVSIFKPLGGFMSILKTVDVKRGIALPDVVFTTKMLTDIPFQQTELSKFR